jgi:lysine-specific demethylase 8
LKKHINYQDIKKKSFIYHLLSWIGPKGSITGFHCDWSENLNIQIKGEKFFYLVSPEFNNCMYISDKFERISSVSMIDLKNYDEKKFPLFKNAKVYKAHLKEGDAIYIPRGWWHYVESLSPSIGVSFHYWKIGGFFRDLIWEVIKVLLHDIGIYKRINCVCHSLNDKGKRLKRG